MGNDACSSEQRVMGATSHFLSGLPEKMQQDVKNKI